MSSWTSYPSIYNLGHRAVKDLLNYPHIVEEKVDGSQFSFGLIECKEEIEKLLWKWAWPSISRQIVRGLPEFYKEQLLKKQFEDEVVSVSEEVL